MKQLKIHQFLNRMSQSMSQIQQGTFSLFQRVAFHDFTFDLIAFQNHGTAGIRIPTKDRLPVAVYPFIIIPAFD